MELRTLNTLRMSLLWLFILNLSVGVFGQQQTFRRRPEDVEVRLGDTAILRCEVENQAGQVQWSQNGFVMGFSRDLPGFVRYSMVGDADKGVHNLRIVNVTLRDIAEYQCQVGPGKSNKPIRSDARLNVLVPPRSVEMKNHSSSRSLEDSKLTLREREPTELECTATNARPAATFIWYRNDIVLRTESREDVTDESEITEGELRVRVNTTTSKIRFIPTAEDDRARYSCEARHPALPQHKKITILLSVQYSPGAPRIDGYTEGDPLRENQSLTLTCVSRGGNPLAELIWFKNDVRVDSSYSTLGRESRNELNFVAAPRDNLARFRCEATNIISPTPKIADVVTTVLFSPKELKVSGPKEGRVGESVVLTCTASAANPRIELAWFRGGLPITTPHTNHVGSPDGGWTAASNISLKIEATDRSLTIACQAINRPLADSKSTSHVIHVIQPPGQPRIYKALSNITAGQVQRVTCTSTGGHPPANLTWFRAGKKVDSLYSVEGNMASAELRLEGNQTDNGVTYACEAKNKAIRTPLKESLTFTVLFPPSSVTITTTPRKLREGQRANLTCESTSSNPPAVVSWWRNGVALPSTANLSRDGSNGGRMSKAVLELEVAAELDGAVYTCQAHNGAVKRSVHDGITLQVLYKPKFLDGVVETVTAVEGDWKEVVVRAKGNPDQVDYKWSRNGSTIRSSANLTINGSLLNFTEISRRDRGAYKVEASNSQGSNSHIIQLDVQYPPTIRVPSEWVMVGEGENAQLECQIDSNPLDESMVRWSHESFELSSVGAEPAFQDNRSYLTLGLVTRNMSGPYTCSVDNGVGEPANATIHLLVKHKPEIDDSPEIARAASNKGGTARLHCRARGAPNVTFSWSREGEFIKSGPKYSIIYSRVDWMLWESVLEVRGVGSGDYGGYTCIAQNELDSAKHSVRLDVTSPPETPLALRVVNFTHDSVTLAFTAGFNGGFPQSFRVRYKKVGSDFARYEDVGPGISTYMVGGLALGTEYAFAVMAKNVLGESNYSTEIVRQETSSVGPESYSDAESTAGGGLHFPSTPFSRFLLGVFTALGAAMLLLNLLLILCFIKRKRRNNKRPPNSSVLDGRNLQMLRAGDVPRILIISVSIFGALLFLINILALVYFLHKKKTQKCRKSKQDEVQSEGSSKSATIEMYAPSSYNETVNGETLSSISEKSASYSGGEPHEEFNDELGQMGGYPFSQPHNNRASTLPRQPKQNLHLMQPHQDEDGYLRRAQYNQNNTAHIGTYGLRRLGKTPQVPPIPELYNIPPEAAYLPHTHTSPLSNGSLGRHQHLPHSLSAHSIHNQNHQQNNYHQDPHQNQLHQMNMSNGGPYGDSNKRVLELSPVRGSLLTTFIPSSNHQLQQTSPHSNSSIEHEGHLV